MDENNQNTQSEQAQEPEKLVSDTNTNKVWTIIGYIIPILFFVSLIGEETKNDKFARYHANQQLIVLIVLLAGWILSLSFVGFLIHLFGLILIIAGIINVSRNHMKPVPLVGKITIIK